MQGDKAQDSLSCAHHSFNFSRGSEGRVIKERCKNFFDYFLIIYYISAVSRVYL